MNIQDSMWIEKYRPKKIDELVLTKRYKHDFEKMIARQDLANLLFSGPPGGGKTTLARILCSKNGVLHNKKDNLLFVNGSSKKERSINHVDTVIEPFLRHPPMADKYRVVLIDEADNLSRDAFRSLRGIIEKYHVAYARFIFTCNYPSNIPDALHSRFIPYRFKQVPKETVINHSKYILDSEKIEYEDKDVLLVVESLYPDVRKIVNALYQNSLEEPKDKNNAGRLDVNEAKVTTDEKIIVSSVVEIVKSIENNQSSKIGTHLNKIIEVLEADIADYRSLYVTLFYMDKFPVPAKIIINKYSNSHQGCLIPSMHFIAMIYEIVKSLHALRKAYTGK